MQEEEVAVEPETNGSSGSIMEQLRARHSELLESKTRNFAVPGYQGEMISKYKVLDSKEMVQIGALIRKQIKDPSEQQLTAAIDMLIKCCVEIFYKGDDGSDPIPLAQVMNSPTEVRFDAQLAEFIGYPNVDTARGALYAVFAENEVAIMAHAMEVQEWMVDTTREADGSLAGEL